MGAVFVLPYARVESWTAGPALLRDAGFEIMALTPGADAVDLGDVGSPARVAVLVGTEGAGLSGRWMAESRHRIRIPMSAGVDSLNVGAAAAIALYVLRPHG
jgi:tRNA G18 (ribose-2'-O)-methylase SpoU